jgi:hypothetical protein
MQREIQEVFKRCLAQLGQPARFAQAERRICGAEETERTVVLLSVSQYRWSWFSGSYFACTSSPTHACMAHEVTWSLRQECYVRQVYCSSSTEPTRLVANHTTFKFQVPSDIQFQPCTAQFVSIELHYSVLINWYKLSYTSLHIIKTA